MTLSVHGIARALGLAIPESDISISGWSIDSRSINPGDCFFALRGPSHDGHDFVRKVFEQGAALSIVERHIEGAGLQLVVPNAEQALARLAAAVRARMTGVTVIGVTGSAGKTTTKDTVASLAATRFRTGKTVGNFNNHLGLPLSILRLPDDCKVAVLEMGMNHAGEIRALAQLAKPSIGVITNVGWAHTENFPDGIEGVSRAKRELIEELPPNGIAILNADDPRVREFAKIHPGRSIFYGFSEDAEASSPEGARPETVRAENVVLSPSGVKFRALGVDYSASVAGRHAVSNLLAGIAVARALGIDPDLLRPAVAALSPGKMRGEHFVRNGVTIINDCYNANPEATRSMIGMLSGVPAQRRIAVLGEMLELGREAETLHRDTGRFTAEQGIHAVIGIRGAARFIVDQAVKSGMSDSAAFFFDSSEAAGDFLRDFLRPGDAVLFKGSRGVQVEKALNRVVGEGGN